MTNGRRTNGRKSSCLILDECDGTISHTLFQAPHVDLFPVHILGFCICNHHALDLSSSMQQGLVSRFSVRVQCQVLVSRFSVRVEFQGLVSGLRVGALYAMQILNLDYTDILNC